MKQTAPTIAVVIATFNRHTELRDALLDAVQQLPASSELLVVDQSEATAKEQNRALVHGLEDPRVRLIEREPGLPAARNAGVANTSASIVLFLDDDVRLSPGCLQAHLAEYTDPTVGGVVGAITERSAHPNARRTVNRVGWSGRVHVNLSHGPPMEIHTLKGCNMSLRRSAIEQAGGFDPGYIGTAFLEDADISVRVRACGWRLRFAPSAHLRHLSARRGGVRVADALRTEAWRFHNTGRFIRRHRHVMSWPAVAAVFGVIAVKRGVELRQPAAPGRLMADLLRGARGV